MLQMHKSNLENLVKIYHTKTALLNSASHGRGEKKEISIVSNVLRHSIDSCPVCLELPSNPVRYCNNDKHILCRNCYDKSSDDDRRKCFVCKSQNTRKNAVEKIDKALSETIKKAEYFCPAGCGRIMEFKVLNDHFPTCRPLHCGVCIFSGNAEELEEHQKSCQSLLTKCLYCHESYLINKVKEHRGSCQEFPVDVKLPNDKVEFVARKHEDAMKLFRMIYKKKRPEVEGEDEEGVNKKIRLSDRDCELIKNATDVFMDCTRKREEEFLPKRPEKKSIPDFLNYVGINAMFSHIFDENGRLKKGENIVRLQKNNLSPRYSFTSIEPVFNFTSIPVLISCDDGDKQRFAFKYIEVLWANIDGVLYFGLRFTNISDEERSFIKLCIGLSCEDEYETYNAVSTLTIEEFKNYSSLKNKLQYSPNYDKDLERVQWVDIHIFSSNRRFVRGFNEAIEKRNGYTCPMVEISQII